MIIPLSHCCVTCMISWATCMISWVTCMTDAWQCLYCSYDSYLLIQSFCDVNVSVTVRYWMIKSLQRCDAVRMRFIIVAVSLLRLLFLLLQLPSSLTLLLLLLLLSELLITAWQEICCPTFHKFARIINKRIFINFNLVSDVAISSILRCTMIQPQAIMVLIMMMLLVTIMMAMIFYID